MGRTAHTPPYPSSHTMAADPVSVSGAADLVVKLVRPFIQELSKQAWPPCAKRSADKKLETATRLFNEWLPHMTEEFGSELRKELTAATTHQTTLCTLQRKHGRAVIFAGSFWSTTRRYRRLARIAHDDAVTASNDARVKSADSSRSNGNRSHSPRLNSNVGAPSIQAQDHTNRIVIENHSTSSGTIFNNVYELPESDDCQSLSILVLNTGQTSQVNTVFTRTPSRNAPVTDERSGQASTSRIKPSLSNESAFEEVTHVMEDGSILKLSKKDIESLFDHLSAVKDQGPEKDSEDTTAPFVDDLVGSDTGSQRALIIGAIPQDNPSAGDDEGSVQFVVGVGEISCDHSQISEDASDDDL